MILVLSLRSEVIASSARNGLVMPLPSPTPSPTNTLERMGISFTLGEWKMAKKIEKEEGERKRGRERGRGEREREEEEERRMDSPWSRLLR